MRVIEIDGEGKVREHDGEPDFWMDTDISWSAATYPGNDDHHIYHDDDAMMDPGQVRISLSGVEVPLPVWITGEDGEDTGPATISLEQVRQDMDTGG